MIASMPLFSITQCYVEVDAHLDYPLSDDRPG
jgi:hypothetical protein